jgi:two-component system, cell cycle response regulator DivK
MTKVLYIEDNEDNIYMLKTRLERKGFEVLIATDGFQGYETALATKPDIILLDVGLPGMDGYETTKKIKNTPEISSIPIIILTAHAQSVDRDNALAAGAQDYESKPINMALLLEKIALLTQHE